MNKSKSGFTIIEVVLVLAVAGLIFLMVFVALPAMQRSQRDTQRREDLSRVASAMVKYKTDIGFYPSPGMMTETNTIQFPRPNKNDDIAHFLYQDDRDSCIHNARTARSLCLLAKNYLSDDSTNNTFKSPNNEYYKFTLIGGSNSDKNLNSPLDTINIIYKAKCDGSNGVEDTDSEQGYAITTTLEGGGIYCIDSGQD